MDELLQQQHQQQRYHIKWIENIDTQIESINYTKLKLNVYINVLSQNRD